MTGLVDGILGIIGTIIYPLFGVIYSVIDLVERIFRAFAGTETVYVSGDQVTSGNTGADTDTGIVYYLLRSDLVRNMFLAMLYLAIILLVVFTIMAVLKNMYQPQPKKWQDIIASAIKGLGLFIIVPACSLLAVWVGNILLVAIDGATSGSNSSATMSGRLFIAASYTSNYIRSDAKGIDLQKHNQVAALCDRCGIEIRAFQPTDGGLDTDYEYYASLVDDCFASEAMSAARCNWVDVNAHYAIIHINFLTLAAGGIFMLFVLGSISFGMVKRLFMLVILFIISPVVCSMYPIDEGNAYKSWFGEFKKNLLSAYGAVAGMNLFLTIMPIVDQIQLGASGGNGDWVGLLQLILVIAGLFVVKDVISFISGLAGGDNSYSGGNSLFVSVRGKAKSGLGKIGSGATKLRHGGSMAYQASKAAKASGGSGTAAFFKQTGSSVLSSLNSGLSKTTGLDFSGIVKGGASKDEIDSMKKTESFRAATRGFDPNEKDNITRNKALENVLKSAKDLGVDDKVIDNFFKGVAKKNETYNKSDEGKANPRETDPKKIREQYETMLTSDAKQGALARASASRDEFMNIMNTSPAAIIDGMDWGDRDKKRKELGFDIMTASADLKLTPKEISDMILKGVKFSNVSFEDVKKENPKLSNEDIMDVVKARNNVNSMVDEANARNAAVTQAGNEVADAVKSAFANAGLAGDKAVSADEIKNAVSQAVSSNATSSKSSIDALLAEVKKVEDAIKNDLAKSVKEGAKDTIKEIKKSKEPPKGDKK